MLKTIYRFARPFLPGVLLMLAAELKNRDANDAGADDALGQIFNEVAPLAAEDFNSGANENAVTKAMRAINRVSGAYLEKRTPATTPAE